ncbi:MAG: hypothetical protein ACK5IJ_09020 [Mangrovibacterium sp.]
MKQYLYILMCSCFLMTMTNCSDLDPLPWTQNDAFITTKYDADSVIVHGLSLYSRSNKRLLSSQATSPSGEQQTMNVYMQSQPYEFLWNTSDADFSIDLPEAGTYSFEAYTKDDNEKIIGTDVLKNKYILPTKVVTCAFDSINSKLSLVWRKVEGASYSVLFIKNEANQDVYATTTLAANDTVETITKESKNWLSVDYLNQVEGAYVPTDGEELTIHIVTYKKDANDVDETLLDAQSVTDYNFIWKDKIEIAE